MSLSVGATFETGTVETIVTSNRGLNPDELTRMLLPKLLYIAPDSSPESQALGADMKAKMEALLKRYFAIAQKCEHTTVYNELMNAGHPDAAEIVRKL